MARESGMDQSIGDLIDKRIEELNEERQRLKSQDLETKDSTDDDEEGKVAKSTTAACEMPENSQSQSKVRVCKKPEGIAKEDFEEMAQIFDVFDGDMNGEITVNELRNIIRSLGQSTTEAEAIDIMNSIDSDANGVIEFPEFSELVADKLEKIKSNQHLEEVFHIFDKDGTGEINTTNLQRMFLIFGQNFTEKEIEAMLSEADQDKDGKVCYNDFAVMMMQ
eukprot:gene19032-20945_t